MSLRATNMTIEEQQAWEDMARTGELARYLKIKEPSGERDYHRALKARVEKLRSCPSPA